MEIEVPKWRAWRITRRWNGRRDEDQEIVDYCLKKLEGKQTDERNTRRIL